jgi:hypothetical protein
VIDFSLCFIVLMKETGFIKHNAVCPHVELQNKTDDFNDTFMNVMPLKGIVTLCFVISNNK